MQKYEWMWIGEETDNEREGVKRRDDMQGTDVGKGRKDMGNAIICEIKKEG